MTPTQEEQANEWRWAQAPRMVLAGAAWGRGGAGPLPSAPVTQASLALAQPLGLCVSPLPPMVPPRPGEGGHKAGGGVMGWGCSLQCRVACPPRHLLCIVACAGLRQDRGPAPGAVGERHMESSGLWPATAPRRAEGECAPHGAPGRAQGLVKRRGSGLRAGHAEGCGQERGPGHCSDRGETGSHRGCRGLREAIGLERRRLGSPGGSRLLCADPWGCIRLVWVVHRGPLPGPPLQVRPARASGPLAQACH